MILLLFFLYPNLFESLCTSQNPSECKMSKHSSPFDYYLSVIDYGADPLQIQDSASSFNRWFQDLSNAKGTLQGFIPPGNYKLEKDLIWDFANLTNGVTISGIGCSISVLRFEPGFRLLLQNSNKANFYMNFRDFGITGSVSGQALFQMGRALISQNAVDEFNSCLIQSLWIVNNANDSKSIAIQINGLYNSNLFIIANAIYGIALQCNACQFSTIQGSYSTALIGISLTNGYSFGNTFFKY